MISRLCYRRYGCYTPQECTAHARCPGEPSYHFKNLFDLQNAMNKADRSILKAISKGVPPMTRSRFDYIAYDSDSSLKQAAFKAQFQLLEHMAAQHLRSGRWTSLLMAKLEEAYVAIGKAIRDDQIERTDGCYAQSPLQEKRCNE